MIDTIDSITSLPTSQWETFGWTHHPDRPEGQGRGVLVRNRTTGHYALALGGSLAAVRQGWARKEAERLTPVSPAELRATREAWGMTQQQLADALGVTQPLVSAMEAGKEVITTRTTRTLEMIRQLRDRNSTIPNGDTTMHTQKIATITLNEDSSANGTILYAGTYRVSMPEEYDPALVTGVDILSDDAVWIVDDEDEATAE